MPEKIAILCSDLHFSHSPPLARSGEPDWYEAMARPLRELNDLAEDVPVLCGGDVFDRWSSPPELVNFAVEHLPNRFWSIAGQHDLPYHSWENRRKSSFWTLVLSQTIHELWDDGRGLGTPVKQGIRAWGFNWGEELPATVPGDWGDVVKVLVAHQYVWIHAGPSANPILDKAENHVRASADKLKGFDVVLFGDNHRGFLTRAQRPRIFNAGTLMRRHADERSYRPMLGVLFEDGSVELHYLDTFRDVFDSSDLVREAEKVMLHLGSFLDELQKLGETGLDFRRAVEIAMEHEQVSRGVRGFILDALEKKGG